MYYLGIVGTSHLRFWAQVTIGIGYAFLLIGTTGSIAVVVVGDSIAEFSRSIGIFSLLATWLSCSLLILFGSYVMWRTDVWELEESRTNEADE